MSQSIEVLQPEAPRGRFRFALFDFDGTLSLIREGWQGVMVPYFLDELTGAPGCEPREQVETVVREFVTRLTGKQTIYQCFQLAEEVRRRGGEPREPLAYKHEYLRRLWERIAHRVEALRSGAVAPDALLLRGSRAFLEALRARDIALYLASGTDLAFVRDEAEALDVAEFFGPHIYGALDDYKAFSKQQVIERLMAENALRGPELLVVGDGYVEIENGKAAGGFALGVASDEANPGGLDQWKCDRLAAAGADAIVRDFAETDALMDYLFGG